MCRGRPPTRPCRAGCRAATPGRRRSIASCASSTARRHARGPPRRSRGTHRAARCCRSCRSTRCRSAACPSRRDRSRGSPGSHSCRRRRRDCRTRAYRVRPSCRGSVAPACPGRRPRVLLRRCHRRRSRRAETVITPATSDNVPKILRPSSRYPPSTGVAVVIGRVRSVPGSVTFANAITPVPSIPANASKVAACSRSPDSRAARTRRPTMRHVARCMLTAMLIEPSARPSRLSPTMRSCADTAPRPPDSTGRGAVRKPLSFIAAIASCGKVPSRSCCSACSATETACISASSTKARPGSVSGSSWNRIASPMR